MTDFPDLKIKALVSFPANVVDGTGVDVVKQNGSYQFNLAFDDFAPPTAIVSDPANQYALLWNVNTNQYALTQVAALSSTVSPSTAIPLPDATPGLPGGSLKYSREDHVHPTDTSRASATTQAVRFDTAQALTSETVPYGAVTQRAQARMNIYAAPMDALAYSGMQINGSMEVSQELGTAGINVAGYVCDGFKLAKTSTAVISAIQTLAPTLFPGFSYVISVVVTTAGPATPAVGDSVRITHLIEGYRIVRLSWGAANAQPITIGFSVRHIRTGTYSVSVRNWANTRSYVTTYTQNVSDTSEYKTVTVPGCTDGVWEVTNNPGLTIDFAMSCGTNLMTTPGAWAVGAFVAATSQVNAVQATTDRFRITGVVILPGIEAPSSDRSALIMRPFDQELLMCKRYFEILTMGTVSGINTAVALNQMPWSVTKRTGATLTASLSSGTGATFSNLGAYGVYQGTANSIAGTAQVTGDARL